MKFNKAVSSSRSKQRKAHFNADSTSRRILMSAPLSKELRAKYGVRSMPVRKGDTVVVLNGDEKKKTGKALRVTQVYRKKFIIHLADTQRNKANGSAVDIPVRPSNVVITDLYMNGNRAAILARKSKVSAPTEAKLD